MAATQSNQQPPQNEVTKRLGAVHQTMKDSETTIKQAQAILEDLKEDADA